MKNELAPIVLFVYNRLDKVKCVIESLEQCTLAEESDIYIYADAPRKNSDRDKEKVRQVQDFLITLEYSHSFKSVTIKRAECHKGLADSVISGVTEVLTKKQKVIVLEDDLVLARDFLEYMNNALDYYNKNKKIWAISGYSLPLISLETYNKDVYFAYRMGSWGWATWLNRWEIVDWKVKDFSLFKISLYKQYKLNRGGYDLSQMLIYQRQRKVDSWAIRWGYEASKHNMLTVYPTKTLVLNQGFDGSGTNCGKQKFEQLEFSEECHKREFSKVIIEKKIIKEFQVFCGMRKENWLEYYFKYLFFKM